MNVDTFWHQPDRGFFWISKGEKVRRVKPNTKAEKAQLQRHEQRGEVACVVRLDGHRRVILRNQATWEE
jgi:hypothetical protein